MAGPAGHRRAPPAGLAGVAARTSGVSSVTTRPGDRLGPGTIRLRTSEAISSAAATSANPSDQRRIGESHGELRPSLGPGEPLHRWRRGAGHERRAGRLRGRWCLGAWAWGFAASAGRLLDGRRAEARRQPAAAAAGAAACCGGRLLPPAAVARRRRPERRIRRPGRTPAGVAVTVLRDRPNGAPAVAGGAAGVAAGACGGSRLRRRLGRLSRRGRWGGRRVRDLRRGVRRLLGLPRRPRRCRRLGRPTAPMRPASPPW